MSPDGPFGETMTQAGGKTRKIKRFFVEVKRFSAYTADKRTEPCPARRASAFARGAEAREAAPRVASISPETGVEKEEP